MHISFYCATRGHDECNGTRQSDRTPNLGGPSPSTIRVGRCDCPCHGHTLTHGTAVTSSVPCDWEIVTVERQAERLLTGQEA